jgi:SAM-dependent methyltransferase
VFVQYDREWYEKSYKESWYNKVYAQPIPQWAQVSNRFHVHQVIAWLGLDPKQDQVLDLGSGVGRYIDMWEECGFKTQGVEHSQTAIELSGRKNILCSDIASLPFADQQFTVAFSAAVMEHVPKGEHTDKAIKEMARCAKYLAHYIPMEEGGDPSHIHIQPPEEWIAEFSLNLGPDYVVIQLPNPIEATQPLFLTMRETDIPYPLTRQQEPAWRLTEAP